MKDLIGRVAIFTLNCYCNDKAHPFSIHRNYVKISFLSHSCSIIIVQPARKRSQLNKSQLLSIHLKILTKNHPIHHFSFCQSKKYHVNNTTSYKDSYSEIGDQQNDLIFLNDTSLYFKLSAQKGALLHVNARIKDCDVKCSKAVNQITSAD